jgi:hypothetical protein
VFDGFSSPARQARKLFDTKCYALVKSAAEILDGMV